VEFSLPRTTVKEKFYNLKETYGLSNYDLMAVAVPVVALAAYFMVPRVSGRVLISAAGSTIDYIYRCEHPDSTDLAGADWFPRIYSGWQVGTAWDWVSKCMVSVYRKPSNLSNQSSVLDSQSGRGQPISRYDRSRYENNGRPDDSYTHKKDVSRVQYKKCYFKDGSMRMVPIGPAAEKTAINPRPSAPSTSTFSGISMDPTEMTRDLTTEKEFSSKKVNQMESAKSSSYSIQEGQDEGGDGDVGW